MQSERPPAPHTRRGRSRRWAAQPGRACKPAIVISSLALLLLGGFFIYNMRTISAGTLLAARDFYGVLRVWERNRGHPQLHAYQLTHGKTAHGFQFVAGDMHDLPTTYYAESSGVGLALQNHPGRPGQLRVGGLGLGIGIIASYGQPGDVFRFYEINPHIVRLAQGEGGYFSYLADSLANIQIVTGDARVSLERELASAGPQGFDLLVLDAFSGDAVPLHLLTREAFEIYLKHLQPDGVVAINISNRYFDLSLPVYRLAGELGLGTALIEDRGDAIRSYDSVWMLLSRERGFLEQPAIAERSVRRPIPASLPLWTDDFGNLLQVLR